LVRLGSGTGYATYMIFGEDGALEGGDVALKLYVQNVGALDSSEQRATNV
jgi:hypothetical protein